MPKFEDGSYQCLPGPALIAKVLAGRCRMNYTRAAVGQGTIPEDVSPKSLTEPPDYVMDAKIVVVTNPVDGECQVTVQSTAPTWRWASTPWESCSMEEKLDIFLVASKITAEEYTELIGMLPNKAPAEAAEE